MALDDNKIIRVILEGVDSISDPVKRATKNVKNSINDLEKSFGRGKKSNEDYEKSWFRLSKTLEDVKRPAGELNDVIHDMSEALQNSQKEVKKTSASFKEFFNARRGRQDAIVTGIKERIKATRQLREEVKKSIVTVQDIEGEATGHRTIRNRQGKIVKGKGLLPGDRFILTQGQELEKINNKLNTSLSQGYRISKNAAKEIDRQLGATKEIRKQRLAELETWKAQKVLASSIAQDVERAKQATKVEQEIIDRGLYDERIAVLKRLNAAKRLYNETQEDEHAEQMQRIEDEYNFIGKKIRQVEVEISTDRTRRFQEERKEINKTYNIRKANIKNISRDEANAIIDKIKKEREALLSSGTRRDRITKNVGFAFGDFFGGIGRGRSNIRDLDKDLEKLSSRFGRLGFAIGSAFKNMNSFVNLRWLFITSAIVLLINVLTQLVVVLVSIASSAIIAAEALGGALVAGITQAIPVVGLLAASFHSLSRAMDAAKLQDKASVKSAADAKEAADKRKQAMQALADAHYSVKQAIQGVSDAQYGLEQSNKSLQQSIQDQKDAVLDLAKAKKQAAQDIVDANLQEKDSALALEEAELAVLQAKEKLRQEEERGRKNQANVTDAQAAVKEAQDRLKLAQQQGDNAEIILANQQLSFSEQNLNRIQDAVAQSKNDLKDAELGVERSEINRKQAVSKKNKDSKDALELRKKGVAQADIVLQAEKDLTKATEAIASAQHDVAQSQRGIADSIHSLAIARREEADAKAALADKTNLQSTAQKNLNEAIADLSPAEKRLYKALVRVKNAYKKTFSGTNKKDGILAPIIDSFASIADAITKVLTDPKITKALSNLAKTIGEGIERFGRILSSKSFRDDLLFFITEATDNFPKILNILISIFNLFRKIGREAAPIFSNLIGGLDGLLARADKAAGQNTKVSQTFAGRPEEGTRGPNAQGRQTRLGSFFEQAEKQLKTWLELGKAIGYVLQQLINVSAPTGQSLIESATSALRDLGDYIKENPEAVQKFFNSIADSFRDLSKALLRLSIIFGKAAKNENIQNFAIFLVDTIVPGIYLMIEGVGLLTGALNGLTKIPILGKFLKFGLQVLVAEKALNKLFPVTQGLTNIIRKGLTKSFSGLFFVLTKPKTAFAAVKTGLQVLGENASIAAKKVKDAASVMKKQWAAVGTSLVETAKKSRVVSGLSTAFSAVVGGIKAVALAMKALLFTPPYIFLAISAIIAAIILLDRKFHFLAPTIKFIKKVLIDVFEWAKKHWKLLLAIFLFPFGAAVYAIIKWRDKIIGFFKFIIDWVKNHWKKLILAAVLAPFALGGAIILGLFKFRGKILEIFKTIGSGIKKVFKEAFDWVREKVGDLGGFIQSKLEKLPVIGRFFKDNAKATPSQILNADQADSKVIAKLRKQGNTDKQILAILQKRGLLTKEKSSAIAKELLGYSGGTSNAGNRSSIGATDTVPAMLTPGEWVLNKTQIRRLANALGVSVSQAKAQIFGTQVTPGSMGHNLAKNMKPSKTKSPFIGGTFTLIPQEDDYGETVWFIQLADGTFGQVTDRDATKIQNTNGRYIPNYVKRNSHGFSQRISTEMNPLGFANGGIIPSAIRGFAAGGVVQQPGHGNTTNGGTSVQQNFNVKTEGATDWAYVMRLSAITAQSAF